jgi:enoyl-CoA hydratase/carnithine racemase
MPEVAIGLFPDVGGSYFLSRMPHGIGLLLGLSGMQFSGYDAIALGMAEILARAERKNAVLSGLRDLVWSKDENRNKETLKSYLAGESDPSARNRSELWQQRETIERLVAGKTIEEIDAKFRAWSGNDPLIERAIRGYLAASPTSVKVVFEQMRSGRAISLRDAFLREWDMAIRFCEKSDFIEGVRARLVDKDNRPRWDPPALAAVGDENAARYFSPHGGPHPLEEKFRAAGL